MPDDVTGSASRKTVSSLIGTNGAIEAPRTHDSPGSRCSIGTSTVEVAVVINLISVVTIGMLTGNCKMTENYKKCNLLGENHSIKDL